MRMQYVAVLCCGLILAGCSNGAEDGAVHGAAVHGDKAVAGGGGQVASASQEAVSHRTLSDQTGPLQAYCSQCHAPPSPKLHSSDEWPAVVRRMEHHRMDARMAPIPDAGRKALLAWLQSH